ncbi:MAG: LuxR C-terminal-related transcriptional regulator [Caldimonas sp.]
MRLQPYLDISQSDDLPTFERRLIEFSHEFEFGLVNAMVVVKPPGRDAVCVSVGNVPEAFAQSFQNIEDSKRDPVLKRLRKMNVPFTYDQDLYVRDGAGDLWEEQAKFGYRTGISVALHLQDHKHFLLGVDRVEALPSDIDEVTDLLASLQLLAVHAQDAALRLLGVQAGVGEVPRLTARELEVLKWTMDGKSAWAVGEILSVSENTVNFHLRNVFRKLGSSSKHQAVLKAMSLGLL